MKCVHNANLPLETQQALAAEIRAIASSGNFPKVTAVLIPDWASMRKQVKVCAQGVLFDTAKTSAKR